MNAKRGGKIFYIGTVIISIKLFFQTSQGILQNKTINDIQFNYDKKAQYNSLPKKKKIRKHNVIQIKKRKHNIIMLITPFFYIIRPF